MRLALISDVHGNFWALEAVLADIRRRGVDAIFDLGDVAQGSLRPGDAVALLRDHGIDSVRGNTDRMLLAEAPEPGGESDHALARATLGGDDWQWLGAQPPWRRVEDLFLCHGTPRCDTVQLLETIDPDGVRLATEAEVVSRLAGAESAQLVACGHSHVPRLVRLADGRVCVNPGSVGLQAFQDGDPFPHATQSGSPHARYAIVERLAGDWRVEHFSLPYDWESAARLAMERGRPDRARWLRTGRASF